MQWLRMIAVLQLCATGVLIWKVFSPATPDIAAGAVHATATTSAQLASASPSDEFFSTEQTGAVLQEAVDPRAGATVGTLTEARLRAIIRDELSAARLAQGQRSGPSPMPPEPPYSEAFQQRFEQVSSRLDSVLSRGRLADADMERLHAEIGQLHPKDRRLLLSRLAQAINGGTVRMTP